MKTIYIKSYCLECYYVDFNSLLFTFYSVEPRTLEIKQLHLNHSEYNMNLRNRNIKCPPKITLSTEKKDKQKKQSYETMRKIQSSAERMKKLREKKKLDQTFVHEKFKKQECERIANLQKKRFRVLKFIMILPITNFNGTYMIVSAKKDVNQKKIFFMKTGSTSS